MPARVMYEVQESETKMERWEVEADTPGEAKQLMLDFMSSHLWVPHWNRKMEHGSKATDPTPD